MAPVPEEANAPSSVALEADECRSDPDADKVTVDDTNDVSKATKQVCCCTLVDISRFYWENEFLILVILAICLAYAYPPLGATYLAPQITATWIAVIFIFLMAGLSLKTEDFAKASKRVSFNLFVPVFNFGIVSALAYGLSRFLLHVAKIIPVALADGMLICSALPLTISMVQVLTKAAGGDEAAAIFHSALGNLTGVIISPLLILGYLGMMAVDVSQLGSVFLNLLLRVVLPLIVEKGNTDDIPVTNGHLLVMFIQTFQILAGFCWQ